MKNLFVYFSFICFSFTVRAEDVAIAQLFTKAGVDGTVLIESVQTDQRIAHNELRSQRGFAAASTFKLLNTLIALEEGVIAGADEIIRWDGTRYDIAD